MILQDADYNGLMILFSIIIWIILFIVGVLVTRWRARKKAWNEELKPAVLLNLFWLIVGILCSFIPVAGFIVALLINLFVGAVVASKLYEKEYGESLVFIIIVWIFLIIIYIILFVIIIVIIVAIIIGTGGTGGAGGAGGASGGDGTFFGS